MPKKILFFIGTRPELIKLAPLVSTVRQRKDTFDACVCLTSQHREMLQQMLQWFPIGINKDLAIMRDDQNPIDAIADILRKGSQFAREHSPDMIVVQGDTATAIAGALIGFHANIPVAHVEAGLRSDDRQAPWPEEIYRRLISQIAEQHFAPTERIAQRLREEKVDGAIHAVGNTVIDALLTMRSKLLEDAELTQSIQDELHAMGYRNDRPCILVTGHRRENFGEGLQNICHALLEIAQQFKQYDLVYSVHLNPQVREPVHRLLQETPNIILLPPLDYPHFVYLMDKSHLILTDSGGIQEEAPSLNKPVLVMRNTTERHEVVEAGAAKLVGTQTQTIVDATKDLLENHAKYEAMVAALNPYGDGQTAARIANILTNGK